MQGRSTSGPDAASAPFTATDILTTIDRHHREIAIVTMAPELDAGLDLVRTLVALGIRVSLGHTGATLEIADAAIAAGARHATHLFNRMRPMTHRDPGVVAAVLASPDVTAEIICDGHHVHPAMLRVAIAAKRPSRTIAITDGTSASGLPAGSRARLGGRSITAGPDVARLDGGTIAGSVLTMDRAFRLLMSQGIDIVDVARMCATTPAEALGLARHGVIAAGAVADVVMLNRHLEVAQTWIGGTLAVGRSST